MERFEELRGQIHQVGDRVIKELRHLADKLDMIGEDDRSVLITILENATAALNKIADGLESDIQRLMQSEDE
jgi:cell division protein ZapA (FtsZ GTPase activity inhibitor)